MYQAVFSALHWNHHSESAQEFFKVNIVFIPILQTANGGLARLSHLPKAAELGQWWEAAREPAREGSVSDYCARGSTIHDTNPLSLLP